MMNRWQEIRWELESYRRVQRVRFNNEKDDFDPCYDGEEGDVISYLENAQENILGMVRDDDRAWKWMNAIDRRVNEEKAGRFPRRQT